MLTSDDIAGIVSDALASHFDREFLEVLPAGYLDGRVETQGSNVTVFIDQLDEQGKLFQTLYRFDIVVRGPQ